MPEYRNTYMAFAIGGASKNRLLSNQGGRFKKNEKLLSSNEGRCQNFGQPPSPNEGDD